MARIASYNVENLFARPKVFRTADWTLGEPKLAAYEQVNSFFKKDAYSQQDKAEMKSPLGRASEATPSYFVGGRPCHALRSAAGRNPRQRVLRD